MTSPRELTSAPFWDRQWRCHSSVKIVSPRHGVLGRNGIFLRTMRRHLGTWEKPSVLELGGGAAYRLLALAKWAGARVTAIDYSPVGIEQTETIFAANGCKV